jgi:hypothetical protein
MEKHSQTILNKQTKSFVSVATEFCNLLEHAEKLDRDLFVNVTLHILPLLYIEASMLPEIGLINEEEEPEHYVTEDMYETLRLNISKILAEKDDYLEVFVADMIYSDTPIRQTISEDLTDIYTDIKNFLFVFGQEVNETMNDALFICLDNFSIYWGQKLVNTMRALHHVKYNNDDWDV